MSTESAIPKSSADSSVRPMYGVGNSYNFTVQYQDGLEGYVCVLEQESGNQLTWTSSLNAWSNASEMESI